jgi:aminopeptidase N
MNKINALYLVFLCLISCTTSPEVITNTSGISLDLAQYRKGQVSKVIYDLSFYIPKQKEHPIPSKLKLSVTISDLTNPLYLDFKETSKKLHLLSVNEQIIEIEHELEHLIIPQEYLILGQNKSCEIC